MIGGGQGEGRKVDYSKPIPVDVYIKTFILRQQIAIKFPSESFKGSPQRYSFVDFKNIANK